MHTDATTSHPRRKKRSFLRTFFWAVGAVVLIVALIVAALGAVVQYGAPPTFATLPDSFKSYKVELTPDLVARGKALAEMRGCFDCHLNRDTGSATGVLVPDVPPPVAKVTHGSNITRDLNHGIGSYSDGQLAWLLRTGVRPDGRLLAPWMPRMVQAADEDLKAIIAFLRSDDPMLAANPLPSKGTEFGFLGKALRKFAWKPDVLLPGPIVAPPLTDKVAYGKYVVAGMIDCYACHSANFAMVNNAQPELTPGFLGGGNPMIDLAGEPVFSANITPDPETGIGKWTEQDFIRALREGVHPKGTPLRYPMPHFHQLSEEQASAVFAYLKTVPPIQNAVKK